MNHHYADIRDRISEPPIWFDEAAVPRYCPFTPEETANIYAKECALVEIACQDCGTRFLVAFSYHPMDDMLKEERFRGGTLADSVREGRIHYGDPPNVLCCLAGPTMNSEPIRVVEFWQRGGENRFDWERVPDLERAIMPVLVQDEEADQREG